MSIVKRIGCCLILMLFHINGYAQEIKMYSNQVPSAEEMGKLLFPDPPSGDGINYRSVIIAPAATTFTIGLPIKFGFDSDKILRESKPFIDEVGKMLNLSGYTDNRLLIEGHTDARGSEQYNRFLSERRARAVKQYLIENYRITANQLVIVGMGESQPLHGASPNAPINRRVQFRRAP